MTIDLSKTNNLNEVHALLQGAVSPRPIALASTVDKEGHVNLSPFSFFNLFGTNPAVMVFSPSRRVRDNTTKHTLENVLETMQVVINTVSYAMVEQASLASSEYEKGINEFIKAGFTEEPSILVKPPRVKEAPVSFECRVVEVKSLGTSGGAGNLVICEVLMIHANDSIFNSQGKIDPFKIDNVARMGGDYYCRVNADNIFELPKPVNPVGIGIEQLPASIRNSSVLTGNNLGRLANITQLPSEVEVKAFISTMDTSTLPQDQIARTTTIHQQAQVLLNNGEIKKAWLLLLSDCD